MLEIMRMDWNTLFLTAKRRGEDRADAEAFKKVYFSFSDKRFGVCSYLR
jgi:hypothetical protein